MLQLLKVGQAKILMGIGLAVLAVPAWSANPAHPGTINYVEGQVGLNGQPLSSKSVGSVELDAGQVLETGKGKAEILLTPGVFLRVGDGSAVRLDSTGLMDTRVAVLHGQAMVEVTQLYKENNIRVNDSGATATLIKRGLYEFDPNRVAVFDGEAKVTQGDQEVTLKKGKELPLTNAPLKAVKFDRNVHDELYAWSNVRSEYLSEAAASSARTYVVNGGGWYGGGWYWNPWFSMYSFLPGDGFLYSPFGWGFYSPAYAFYAPVYGYRGGGFHGGRVITGIHPAPLGGRSISGFRATPSMGLSRGFSGGGFSGGFHGGSRR